MNVPKLLQGLTGLLFILHFSYDKLVVAYAPTTIEADAGYVYRYHVGGSEYHFLKSWQSWIAQGSGVAFVLIGVSAVIITLIDIARKKINAASK